MNDVKLPNDAQEVLAPAHIPDGSIVCVVAYGDCPFISFPTCMADIETKISGKLQRSNGKAYLINQEHPKKG